MTIASRKKATKKVISIELLSRLLESNREESLRELYDRRQKEISNLKKSAAKNRRFKKRRSWNGFQDRLSDRQFRRYFRMSRECFQQLCNKIEDNVGSDDFKSERYLRELRLGLNSFQLNKKKMEKAHTDSTGGFISGEIKLALTLRLLAGGSYLDLSLLLEVGFTYSYEIFHHVVSQWINDNNLVNISGEDYLQDDDRMAAVAAEFCRKSNGLIRGSIGAVDGWLVRIRKPQERDGIRNPGSFFSRKGFYAFNLQVVCDKKKRVLFRSMKCRGAEHDSTAFKRSSFYKMLDDNWKYLKQKGYYLIGDSAYSIRSFLITPFDDAMHGTAEDNFNYFHSSSRISIECTFGEIDMRWGILWRPLAFSMKHNTQVIDACLRLHNFIVDFREENQELTAMQLLEKEVFQEDSIRFLSLNPDLQNNGVIGAEQETQLGGRPTNNDVLCRTTGVDIRNTMKTRIEQQRFVRPPANWYRENNRFLN